MKLTRTLMAAMAAALIASPVLAADDSSASAAKADASAPAATAATAPAKMTPKWGFGAYDTNGDGMISKDEWLADAQKKFDEKDANHDGNITKEEWAGAKGMHRKHGKGGSTSTPPANNEVAPKKDATGSGADGAGGATAQ